MILKSQWQSIEEFFNGHSNCLSNYLILQYSRDHSGIPWVSLPHCHTHAKLPVMSARQLSLKFIHLIIAHFALSHKNLTFVLLSDLDKSPFFVYTKFRYCYRIHSYSLLINYVNIDTIFSVYHASLLSTSPVCAVVIWLLASGLLKNFIYWCHHG